MREQISATCTVETPSDRFLLEMLARSKKERGGLSQIKVNYPSSRGIIRLLATALLAIEEPGATRLEMVEEEEVEKKMFFDLFSISKTIPSFLRAIELETSPHWPTGSLEYELGKSGLVPDIVCGWIGKVSEDPAGRAMKKVMTRMVGREFLAKDRKRVLKLFTVNSGYYVLPEQTLALMLQQSEQLLDECGRARPEVHRQLLADVEAGFLRRTRQSTG